MPLVLELTRLFVMLDMLDASTGSKTKLLGGVCGTEYVTDMNFLSLHLARMSRQFLAVLAPRGRALAMDVALKASITLSTTFLLL